MEFKNVIKKFGGPVLAGAIVIGGLTGVVSSPTFAAHSQNPPTAIQKVETQTPDLNGSITVDEKNTEDAAVKDSAIETQEDAALTAKATVSKEAAVNAAKTAYPAYEVKNTGIGNENGSLVYEINMINKSGESLEVKVDAGNAAVLMADKNADETGVDIADNENSSEKEGNDSGVDNDNIEVEE